MLAIESEILKWKTRIVRKYSNEKPRLILEFIHKKEEWTIRYNNEIYCYFNGPTVKMYIKLRRLKWTNHVLKMHIEEHKNSSYSKYNIQYKLEEIGKWPKDRLNNMWDYSFTAKDTRSARMEFFSVNGRDKYTWVQGLILHSSSIGRNNA